MPGASPAAAGAQHDVAAASARGGNLADSDFQSAGPLRIRKLSKVSPARFLLLSLLFHVVYISSIFDIYFRSPIVHGMKEHGVQRAEGVDAPAKRLVLYVGEFDDSAYTLYDVRYDIVKDPLCKIADGNS